MTPPMWLGRGKAAGDYRLSNKVQFTEREALFYHSTIRPGKIEIIASKPMATQRDLSLAYSPGVAVPVQAIADDPATAYDYTAKGNLVAVISNGTAILGMGNLGALASKPVMEGKAVLFKRFADVDSIDIELASEDTDALIEAIAMMEPSFGGINLEDIKAPECFIIEQALRDRMKIPVMHDDQHGTAIIAAAGLINACLITGRKLEDVKMVVNGAGASALACTALIKSLGVRHENVTVCDRTGVIYRGRGGLDQWKSAHAIDTTNRTLEEALVGADVFLGLSAAGALTPEYVRKMADQPIIFAMANPDPEITPPDAKAVRPDAIVATGRSDYPNQVNNVLGFPFIFRGALDVRATAINEEMKIAAARAIAELAREPVHEDVAAAYGGETHAFGREYIIPAPFDPRLMEVVPMAVAKAAMDSGVAGRPIEDFEAYRDQLKARLNPTTSVLTRVYEQVRANPKRVIFAEADNEVVLRAAIQYRDFGYGEPILVGRTQTILAMMADLGVSDPDSFNIENSMISKHVEPMVEMLYERLKRRGFLKRDVQRMCNTDRNIFAAGLLKLGVGDALITGVTRPFSQSMKEIRRVLDPAEGKLPFGIHLLVGKNHTVFMADTTINERPTAEELVVIATETAAVARKLGHQPRVAFLSYSTFGNPAGKWLDITRDAVHILDEQQPDFEYEGEMAPDAALNPKIMEFYPFCRLSAPANVLVMPGLQSANISAKLLREIGGTTSIGPMLLGMEKPVQIVPMTAIAPDVLTSAVLAAAGIMG
ncbi:malate dehydrogenase (oxaloacetate-decarboxylating)(NADP+) [Novosphingobium sp. Rr 2-17]|nr:malate dehydrogenase (oxaloacetate-decarboxylating)(NADP+) [Novosphingobium sp. Rr 2-17]